MGFNKIISYKNEYLDEKLSDENSCIVLEHHKHHLAFHPYHLSNIKESIKEVLNSAVGKYDRKLDGILLSYRNIKLISNVAPIINDNYYIHFDIEANFYLFKPKVNSTLIGEVNKISKDHVGCLVHKFFNVSILRPTNQTDEEEWIGNTVKTKQNVLLKITYLDFESRLPYLRASFISVIDSAEKDSGVSTGDEAVINYNKDKIKRKKTSSENESNQTDCCNTDHKIMNNLSESNQKQEIEKNRKKHTKRKHSENSSLEETANEYLEKKNRCLSIIKFESDDEDFKNIPRKNNKKHTISVDVSQKDILNETKANSSKNKKIKKSTLDEGLENNSLLNQFFEKSVDNDNTTMKIKSKSKVTNNAVSLEIEDYEKELIEDSANKSSSKQKKKKHKKSEMDLDVIRNSLLNKFLEKSSSDSENLKEKNKLGLPSTEKKKKVKEEKESSDEQCDIFSSLDLITPAQKIKRETKSSDTESEIKSSIWKMPPDPELEEIFKKPLNKLDDFSFESDPYIESSGSSSKKRDKQKKRKRSKMEDDCNDYENKERKKKKYND